VVKVRGSPCGGKVNFKWPPFPWCKLLVDESPIKHHSLVPTQEKHGSFFKSASKLAKIGTLRALGGGRGLSYGLG
jgi:hypothetical protein